VQATTGASVPQAAERAVPETAEKTAAKRALYEQFARMGKALGSPLRLLLLDLLGQAERSVEDLAAAAGAAVGNTSAQLQLLRGAGLVTARRQGSRVYYRLASDEVTDLVTAVAMFAERQLAGAERAARAYLGDLGELEPVSSQELRRRLDAGDVVVIDVRPAEEYAAGHIPAARCIPAGELAGRLGELSRDTGIVAYCRGRYCVLAPDAVRLLRERGYAARPLADGLPGWRRAGLRVSAGAAA